jgi:uncharacterized glyoxalase superfamily protein PhnB
MLKNRSVPANVLLPHIVYEEVAKAAAWLEAAFGFVEHYRYVNEDGQPSGIQMSLGDAWLMLMRARPGWASPSKAGWSTQSLTVFVEDVDAHYQRARSFGATIVEAINETAYGERQYGVVDLGGHQWLFARHARDIDPTEWGATLAATEQGPTSPSG